MRIFCDYCQQPFEINEDELDDWITLDPSDGSKVVMCGQCERRPTPLALDGATVAEFCECGISIESHTGVYCIFRPASKA